MQAVNFLNKVHLLSRLFPESRSVHREATRQEKPIYPFTAKQHKVKPCVSD